MATIHPLVLLSVVDHHARVNRGVTRPRRVVGLLLGSTTTEEVKATATAAEVSAGIAPSSMGRTKHCTVDAHNCFAVPFEETPSDDVWFLDTTYAMEMHTMVRKVLPTAAVVGWYSSGSTIDPSDGRIHQHISERFLCNPLYCLINVDPTARGVPVHAYVAVDPRRVGVGAGAARVVSGMGESEFAHIPCSLVSGEAESIGVEQLLRDLDVSVSSLTATLADRALSLQKLAEVLRTIETYLYDVAKGRVASPSQDVLHVIQKLLGMQPLVHQLRNSTAMVVSTNDDALATFIAATARTVMALYDVALNRRRVAAELQALRQKRREAAQATAASTAAALSETPPPTSP